MSRIHILSAESEVGRNAAHGLQVGHPGTRANVGACRYSGQMGIMTTDGTRTIRLSNYWGIEQLRHADKRCSFR